MKKIVFLVMILLSERLVAQTLSPSIANEYCPNTTYNVLKELLSISN